MLWRERCEQAMAVDRHRLLKQWHRLAKNSETPESQWLRWREALDRSLAQVESRRRACPELVYPDLPVSAQRPALLEAIWRHQVIVLSGETGSGKTTQLPKLCLEAGRGVHGLIGQTQPRRLAARAVATRIAEELQSPLGNLVGYKVRFNEETSPASLIKVMTDGILLAELRADRYLSQYDTLIIDEAHERSLNIDFLLGVLKTLLRKRTDLKLIITSATIDVMRFSKHFDNAPIFEISGRTYPVETLYRPLLEAGETEEDTEERIPRAILSAVEECLQRERAEHRGVGDILVFASTEREIRDVAEVLRRHGPPQTDVLPLYARLSAAEQQRVFHAHSGRRIVVATNVAETSLTVPGIHYVIDPGLARISRYSYRSKVQRLPIEPISQASANQRQGRCGRIAPGVCIRLYSETDFNNRPEFTDAEIHRTNLAAVILQMQDLRLGNVDQFPFIDPPDSRLVNAAFRLLEEIEAVDADRQMTPMGKELAGWPLDPRLARIVLAARSLGCLREILIIVSAIAVQDPRERPVDKQQAADQRHAPFKDNDSDFLFFVNLWNAGEVIRAENGEKGQRRWAHENFLSWPRLRDWRETHRQLLWQAQERDWTVNEQAATYEQIHCALLIGFATLVAQKTEDREFQGCRQQKCKVFPGSVLARKPPAWLLAAEWVETQRVYARLCARIEPEWIERHVPHLLKRHHFEPHWERRSGRVMVYEQISLYGLIVNARRKVPFDGIDPEAARHIFIRDALVPGDLEGKFEFLSHNRRLVQEIEALEHKARRRDFLVDEEVQQAFYEQRIPADIHSFVALTQWMASSDDGLKSLFMTRDLLLQNTSTGIDRKSFPDSLQTPQGTFKLRYHFEPGGDKDGVTLLCPVGMFAGLPWEALEWLVPGMRSEKVLHLLRSLPKALRRQLVPLPETVQSLPLSESGSLLTALKAALKRQRGITVDERDFDLSALPIHCFMNIRVLDAQGRVLVEGRDVPRLRMDLQGQVPVLPESAADTDAVKIYRSWEFGDLPLSVTRGSGSSTTLLWPALVEQDEGVIIQRFSDERQAVMAHCRGTLRLSQQLLGAEAKHLRKLLKDNRSLMMRLAPLMPANVLEKEFVDAVFQETLNLKESPLRTQTDFDKKIADVTGRLLSKGQDMLVKLASIAEEWGELQAAMRGLPAAFQYAQKDIDQQLRDLFVPHFLLDPGFRRWQHYPRYLKAAHCRLERLMGNLNRDQQASQELNGRIQALQERQTELKAKGLTSSLLEDYRWMLEEYRVSLFAQQLKTAVPVSPERLNKLWSQLPT